MPSSDSFPNNDSVIDILAILIDKEALPGFHTYIPERRTLETWKAANNLQNFCEAEHVFRHQYLDNESLYGYQEFEMSFCVLRAIFDRIKNKIHGNGVFQVRKTH